MNLISLAKSLKPFIKRSGDLQGIYNAILKEKHIPFIEHLDAISLIKLVFLCSEIQKNGNLQSKLREIDNYLFSFTVIKFGDDQNEIDCDVCVDGEIRCEDCGGSGTQPCSNCDGEGYIDCDECEFHSEGECEKCKGQNYVQCTECNAGRVNCDGCDGIGAEPCQECEGQGYVVNDNYVPYDIYTYVSIDDNLLFEIESQYIDLQKEIDEYKFYSSLSDKTFQISVERKEATYEYTEEIDKQYMEKMFFLNFSVDNISDKLKLTSRGIRCRNNSEGIEKFFD